MPSIARAIVLAVQAASFLALTGISPATTTALASPLPGSSPAVPANSPSSLLAARVVSKHTDTELVARIPIISPVVSAPLQERASTANSSQLVKKLRASHDKIKANHATMKSLAARTRARSVDADDSAYKQECVSTMESYKSNFEEFQGTLIALGSLDKGLACYDRLDDVETIVKDVVNFHKDIMAYTVALVNSIPLLASLLGPTMEAIKCLVDELLDATEVFVDCILNITLQFLVTLLPALTPLLQALCNLLPGLLCLL